MGTISTTALESESGTTTSHASLGLRAAGSLWDPGLVSYFLAGKLLRSDARSSSRYGTNAATGARLRSSDIGYDGDLTLFSKRAPLRVYARRTRVDLAGEGAMLPLSQDRLQAAEGVHWTLFPRRLPSLAVRGERSTGDERGAVGVVSRVRRQMASVDIDRRVAGESPASLGYRFDAARTDHLAGVGVTGSSLAYAQHQLTARLERGRLVSDLFGSSDTADLDYSGAPVRFRSNAGRGLALFRISPASSVSASAAYSDTIGGSGSLGASRSATVSLTGAHSLSPRLGGSGSLNFERSWNGALVTGPGAAAEVHSSHGGTWGSAGGSVSGGVQEARTALGNGWRTYGGIGVQGSADAVENLRFGANAHASGQRDTSPLRAARADARGRGNVAWRFHPRVSADAGAEHQRSSDEVFDPSVGARRRTERSLWTLNGSISAALPAGTTASAITSFSSGDEPAVRLVGLPAAAVPVQPGSQTLTFEARIESEPVSGLLVSVRMRQDRNERRAPSRIAFNRQVELESSYRIGRVDMQIAYRILDQSIQGIGTRVAILDGRIGRSF